MPERGELEQLSTLIGCVYDCAIEPGRWPEVLDQLRVELGAANASMCLIDVATSEQLFDITSNIDPRYGAALADMTDAMYAMWGGRDWFMTTPLDRPTILSRTIDPEQVRRSRYYLEWNRPQGLNDTLGLWLARDPAAFGLMGFRRLERDGRFGPDPQRTATLLIPHLQRAAAINRLLDLAALRQATFAALFDAMATPILLVGHDLRVVHINAAARELLSAGLVLSGRGDMVSALDRSAQAALAAAVRQASEAGLAIGRMGLGIPLPGRDGTMRALHVLPLRPSVAGKEARAAIFVADGAAAPPVVGDAVGALFGLTRAEVAVLGQVTTGHGVPGIASALGIAPSTVRTHLLRMYDKTGVRRQAELVRLCASLAPPALRG